MGTDIRHLEAYKKFTKNVGLVLRHARIQRNFSRVRLGKLAGCTGQMIYYAERAERGLSLETAWMICAVLRIPLNFLAPDLKVSEENAPTLRERVMAKAPVLRQKATAVQNRVPTAKRKTRSA